MQMGLIHWSNKIERGYLRLKITIPLYSKMSSLSQFRDIVSLLFRVVDFKADMEDVDSLLLKIGNLLEEEDASISHEEKALKKHIANVFLTSDLLNPPTPPTLRIHPDSQEEEIMVPTVVVTKAEPETKQVSVQGGALVGNFVVNLPPMPVVHQKEQNVVDVEEKKAKKEKKEKKEKKKAIEEQKKQEDAEIMKALHAEVEEVEVEEEGEAVEENQCEVVAEEEAVEEAVEEEEEAAEEVEEEEVVEEVEEQEQEQEEEEEAMDVIKIKKRKYFVGERSRKVYEYIDDETAGEECLGTYNDATNKIVPL